MNTAPNRELAVFSAALELPASERAAYLQKACANDPALRLHIEALLGVHEKAITFLEAPAHGLDPSALEGDVAGATARLSGSSSEKVGDRIGRYKLLQQIGEGGCGVVYMAEQEEPVRRRVALKVIKLGMDTKEVVARFEAERQALALMDHPNIAKVLDAGATETGRPYFVMELVRGIKITHYCDENNLSTEARLDLFIKVAQAVQHAHQKGIIHRDIKPSNILVADHDGVPVPKVIDFGIAKATTDQRLTDKTLFTAFEQFIGTPAYMSPEQAKMSGLDIDTRTDIYSLGVLLYELLTGKTPFDAQDLLSAGLDEMRRTISEKEPARPSTRLSTMLEAELTTTAKHRRTDAPKLIHRLRGDLDWIAMKALEKDRARRYETANGLAADIQRHLNNEPVVARPPSNLYRFQKVVRRNKLAFAAAAAIVGTLIIGLSVSTALFFTERAARRRAVALERDQRQLRAEAVEAAKTQAQLRQKAEAQELAARQSAYAADMVIAQQAYAAGNYSRVIALLDRHRPNKPKSLNSQPSTDLRGWEWRYLWQLTLGNENFILGRHTTSAHAIAFSPLGRLLASAGADKTLRLWNLETRREKTATLLPGIIISGLAYSPDGAFLAAVTSSSAGRRLTIWDGVTLENVTTLDPTNCQPLSFSPNGAFLAVGVGTELKLWDTGTWRERPGWRSDKKFARQLRFRTTEQFDVEVVNVAIAADNRTMAFATTDGRIHLWDAESRQHPTEWPAHEPNPVTSLYSLRALVFSPNGRTLVSAGADDQINVWDVGTQQQQTNLTEQAAGQTAFLPRSLAFSPDGATLAASGADQTLRLWDTTTWRLINVLKGHRGQVNGVAFSPDGKILASASQDETIRLWDPAATNVQNPFHKSPDDVLHKSLSKSGRYIGMAHRTGSLSLWDTVTMRKMGEWPGIEFKGFDFAVLSCDGSRVAFAFGDGSVRLAETVEAKSIASWRAHAAKVEGLCFSEDTSLLASVGTDRKVRLWELANQRERWTASLSNNAAFFSIAISANNELLCVGEAGGVARVWDVRTGKQLHSLDTHKEWFMGLTISADAKTLVTCSGDGTAQVWLLAATNKAPVTLSSSSRGVSAVALSPDARRLAVVTRDGTVKLWDMATYQEITTFPAQAPVTGVLAFLPDGNTLALAGEKGFYVWRAPSWAQIEAAEAKLGK